MSFFPVKYKKGTILTCEQGHEICEFADDKCDMDIIYADDFTNFREGQSVPVALEKIGDHPCVICGSRWIEFIKIMTDRSFNIKGNHEVIQVLKGFYVQVHVKDIGWV